MLDWKLWLIAPVFCAWPLAASADDSEPARLIAECGAADLPQASVDSCLERARVLDETEPSAQLQSVERQLEKREVGKTVSARAEPAPAPPDDNSRPVRRIAPPAREGDGSLTENYDQDSAQNLSGSEAEDQPPLADPPAGTLEDRSDAEQPDNPQ
jgi:hypothetical protein